MDESEVLAQRIVESSQRFVRGEAEWYQIGGHKIFGGEGIEEEPLEISLRQPDWPAPNSAWSYQKSARLLLRAAKDGKIPWHVPVSESLRAVDCLLTEFLFFCGLYPEREWVNMRTQISFSKKVKLATSIMPREILPSSLLRDVARIRNICEHQFAEPSRTEAYKALEVMDTFLEITGPIYGILEAFSMFKYELEEIKATLVVQIMRDNGSILVFRDGANPSSRYGIPARSDLGKSLLRKIVAEVKWYLDWDVDNALQSW